MPILLELFSGTGSISRVFGEAGWETTSLDSDPRTQADIISDILAWDYKSRFEPGAVDAIWASPPCTQYSVARTKARLPRDLIGADAIVQRTLEIIDYLKPRVWFMENPQTGLLRTRPVVAGIPYAVCDYCVFGRPYRKRTAIWTNSSLADHKCDGQCQALQSMGGGMRHPKIAQKGPGLWQRRSGRMEGFTLDELYAIPRGLCEEILRVAMSIIENESLEISLWPGSQTQS